MTKSTIIITTHRCGCPGTRLNMYLRAFSPVNDIRWSLLIYKLQRLKFCRLHFFNLLIIQACTVESIPISLDWIGWVKLDKHRLGVWEMWWHDNNLRLRWNRWRTRKRTWTRKRQQKFSSQSLFLPAGSRLSSLLTRWDLALILKGCAVWIKNTYESHHSGQIKRE